MAKFELKDHQITTKMRQPDRRPGREVAFIADSTGRTVQPVKPGGDDARSRRRTRISRVRYLHQLSNFSSENFIAREKFVDPGAASCSGQQHSLQPLIDLEHNHRI